jgi:Trk K+ transport system NAD-binding subunit
MEQHFILCGLGRVGRRVLDYLHAIGACVVIIDNHTDPANPPPGSVRVVRGDCRQEQTLRQADVAGARGVLILTSDDLTTVSTALMVRHLHPRVRLVVRMFNPQLVARLGKAAENVYALSASALTAPLLALIARTGEALGTFRLPNGQRGQVAETTVRDNSRLIGLTIEELATRHHALTLAYLPAQGTPRFLNDIDQAARLAVNDRIVICGDPRTLTGLLAQASEESLPELLWASFLRRQFRVFWRTLREIDLPLKIATGVLVGMILLSTLVFHYAVKQDPVPEALYRTISLMATGADMGGRDLEPGGWEKVFISMVRLVGTALTAAFTAILTNYLVRAQLGGALEVRRIPDSGHVVVCGLGNVGFRVVEELLGEGERVVALERATDCPFISTARRLGTAVIIGDAAVPEVLRQAHVARARAVVAATSNDLANLEIALLTRQLNPLIRVVLRLNDSQLARTLREAADIRLAFSIPELSAPTFVAALFGDRVPSVFFVEGRLLAVVDLLVQPEDGFLDGQPVRALAVDYGFAPVLLYRPDRSLHPHPLLARLGPGDCLTVILTLADLQRLLQRERAPRDCAVEVTHCPLPARSFVVQLLRQHRNLGAAEAEQALEQMPVCVDENLTRGQAEDLMYLLSKERVAGRVRRGNGQV